MRWAVPFLWQIQRPEVLHTSVLAVHSPDPRRSIFLLESSHSSFDSIVCWECTSSPHSPEALQTDTPTNALVPRTSLSSQLCCPVPLPDGLLVCLLKELEMKLCLLPHFRGMAYLHWPCFTSDWGASQGGVVISSAHVGLPARAAMGRTWPHRLKVPGMDFSTSTFCSVLCLICA